ncbi:sporulation-induced protein [Coemansia sp. BCRC 34301]|nr:sporulation-induced protein [Coemansia sp. BCRC 34301]
MLWRFGLQHASNIDKLLDKEDLTLEEVLSEPDLLQEVREQNPKVLTYLVLPHNLKQMVEYIATEEFFKFSKMAATSCDVLCSNSMVFAESLVASYAARDFAESDDEEDDDDDDDDDCSSVGGKRGGHTRPRSETEGSVPRQHLLELLWGIMRLPSGAVDLQQATFFSRVMCSVIQRKPYETLDFVRAQGDAVPQFLAHLGVSAIVDLLLKVISLEELEENRGVIAWLSECKLIPLLVDRLGPGADPETHSLAAQVLLDIIAISQCNNPTQPSIGANALIEELKSEGTVTRLTDFMLDREAPHATSTLINCVYIFIELIRRNYSDTTASSLSPDLVDEESRGNDSETGGGRLPSVVVDLSDMMRVLALRTGELVALLRDPRSSTEPVPTTQGLREPLGFERLRICELFAELLHCSNMPRLNHQPVPAKSPSDSPTTKGLSAANDDEDDSRSVYSDVAAVVSEPSDHDAGNTPVGQLLKWNLIGHKVLPTCVDLFFQFSLNNFLHSVVYDIMHQVLNLPLGLECNVALIVVAFRDVRITSRIAQACAHNDQVARMQRGGGRLGYMGHLTGIGEEVARLLELSGAALEPLIAPFIDGDEWLDYVARTLQEVRDRDQQPLGGERPGNGGDGTLAADIDNGVADGGNQVFVSRMGLVDPSSNESYGPEDDDDDEDYDDEEELDDHSEYSAHRHRGGGGGGRGYKPSTSMYPNEEDGDESAIDYVTAHHSYFNPSVSHAEDPFIIKDDDDEDDGIADDADFGPAGRIGRYRSHQNERASMSAKHFDMVGAPAAEDDDDEDDASEIGRMNDFIRNRAADLAETARTQPIQKPATTADDQGNGGGNLLEMSDCMEEEENGGGGGGGGEPSRRQVIRLSFDGSAHTVGDDHQAPLPSYLLSLPSSIAAPQVDPPPETPPRPTPQQTMAFVPPPLLPSSYLPPAISKLKAKQAAAAAAAASGEPKGRVQDLLYHESKQRSLSSSELDNIVPADIASSTHNEALATDDDDCGGRRGRSGSFAARRQRSRSQSAGVGISREMVIQAASQGQFPYLDAKTCEFVGQLKTDTVKMGGAANTSRQRSNTAATARTPGTTTPGSGGTPLSSSPTVKPMVQNGLRSSSLPQSSLRFLPADDDDDDDDDDELSDGTANDIDLAAITLGNVPFTFACVTPPCSSSSSSSALAVPAGSLRVVTRSDDEDTTSRGGQHAMMAPAVEDDDESVAWADFSGFTSMANDIDEFVPIPSSRNNKLN